MVALLVALPLGLGACGSSSAKALRPSSILRFNRATKTVRLLLVASATGADDGFNYDGYGEGAMRFSVPIGWRVDVTCTNHSTTLTHSCAIVADRLLSPLGAPIAFPGASTPDPTTGLGLGSTARFSFVATRAGTYRLSCLVVGHEADGMWDWFVVAHGGSPTVRT